MRQLIAIALLVAACSPADPAPAPTVDVTAYLVQSRCADGTAPVAPCQTTPVTAADALIWRRHDWPAPDGYQVTDAFLGVDGEPTVIWSYPPFGPFDASHGDGGETYAIAADGTVTITATQDGGKPGVQHFVGAACGGTGWIVWRGTPPSGGWASTVARLSDATSADVCPPLGAAFTRWRRETVTVPFLIDGARRDVAVSAIISEHYDGASIETSRHMERSIFGRGWGRLVWEAWGLEPAVVDLSARCPGTAWSTPPSPGWQLEDCRYATNLRPADGSMSGARFGWPPQ